MEQYIPKSALVAEIERRISQLESKYKELSNLEIWITAKEIEHKINGLKEALSIVNILEVKDVDIDKEIGKFFGEDDWKAGAFEEEQRDMIKFAKHFFELGLKAQKGE